MTRRTKPNRPPVQKTATNANPAETAAVAASAADAHVAADAEASPAPETTRQDAASNDTAGPAPVENEAATDSSPADHQAPDEAPDPVAPALEVSLPVPAPVALRPDPDGPTPVHGRQAANDAGEPRTASGAGSDARRWPLSEINETLGAFVRNESAAALAHIHALSQARSPADLIRLQVGEFQRAADASLTCIGTLVRSASRLGAAPHRGRPPF